MNRRSLLLSSAATLIWSTKSQACAPLLTNTTVYPTPSVPKPVYLAGYLDMTFGTFVQRVTGVPGTSIPNVGGTRKWGDVARCGYTKRCPFNCDGSVLWIEVNKNYDGSSTGTSGGIFLDSSGPNPTYAPLFDGGQQQKPSGDLRWHPTNPNKMYYMTSGGEFGLWDISNSTQTPIRTFSGYTNMGIGVGEGNSSLDGDVWVFSGTKNNRVVCFAYKISTDNKYPDIDPYPTLGGDIDNCTVNLAGTRVVVQYDPENIAVYSLNGVLQYDFGLPEGQPSHWDITETSSGVAVVIGVAKGGVNGGKVIRRKISDGTTVVLTTGDSYASHTSCRATALVPPIAVVSYEKQASYPLYSGEIVAVNALASGVHRICHTHNNHPSGSDPDNYEQETHAVPDPTASRVAFSSNWGTQGGQVSTYICSIYPRCPF